MLIPTDFLLSRKLCHIREMIFILITNKGEGMVLSPSQVYYSDPDAIRTRDRLLRRQMLYPAELPDRP